MSIRIIFLCLICPAIPFIGCHRHADPHHKRIVAVPVIKDWEAFLSTLDDSANIPSSQYYDTLRLCDDMLEELRLLKQGTLYRPLERYV